MVTAAECIALGLGAFTARDGARHWLRIAIFAYPPALDASVREVPVGILP